MDQSLIERSPTEIVQSPMGEEESVTPSRQRVNELMLIGAQRGDEPIPFLCECDRDDCDVLACMTAEDFELKRRDPTWAAVAPEHDTRAAA
jgi:hypothetical protein